MVTLCGCGSPRIDDGSSWLKAGCGVGSQASTRTLTIRPDPRPRPTSVQHPEPFVSPGQRIFRRVIYATLALFAAVLIVYLDRDGYRDVESSPDPNDPLSFLDCLYYATVSLSTTGYGDITPVTPSARLINVLVITPLRIAFLIVLIGTTVETLTTQSRQALKIQRWRSRVRNHTVVVGYGTKGRTAVAAMVGDEVAPADIVVVDENAAALERAKSAGLVTVHGDATNSEVLRLASAQHAKSIIVATDDDASAVLVTLTARELAPNAKIIAAVREAENQHLLRPVRRGLHRGVVGDRRPAAGHSDADPERCRDDGRPTDTRRRVRDRRTRSHARRRPAARRGT